MITSDALYPLTQEEIRGLKEDLAALVQIRDEQAEKIRELEDRVAAKSSVISGLNARIETLERQAERLKPLRSDQVYELAKARRFIKGGDVDEGLYRLEASLDWLDPAWRAL